MEGPALNAPKCERQWRTVFKRACPMSPFGGLRRPSRCAYLITYFLGVPLCLLHHWNGGLEGENPTPPRITLVYRAHGKCFAGRVENALV